MKLHPDVEPFYGFHNPHKFKEWLEKERAVAYQRLATTLVDAALYRLQGKVAFIDHQLELLDKAMNPR